MVNTKPYVVLTTWKWGPKGRYASKIGKALTDITAELGLKPFKNDEIKRNDNAIWSDYEMHAEVRRTAVPGSEGTSFHRDGDTSTSDMDCALVLWTSRDPTEFKFNGSIFQPLPFELYIARNMSCLHRRPPKVSGKRWSFRQRVEVPTWMELP